MPRSTEPGRWRSLARASSVISFEKDSMRHYLYIDKNALSLFCQQLQGSKPQKRRKTVGLSLTGPRVDLTEEDDSQESHHQMIERLIKGLQQSNLLSNKRPAKVPYQRPKPFVLETTEAAKVVLPKTLMEAATGMDRSLAVWVAEPELLASIPDNPYETVPATFLYLTDSRLDNGDFQTTLSGCSTLQAIANAAAGKHLRGGGSSEHLGMESYVHPVSKLIGLGGVTTGELRTIQSLYRIRYMTDEQQYTYHSKPLRTNDLLGYPLFVAEPLDDS